MKIFLLSLVLIACTSCAPRAVPVDFSAQSEAPAPRLPGMTESNFVILQGERVYYESGGEGETPVLLVHGIGAGNSSHLWRKNTEALSEAHSVYALDLPGFARSGARARQYTNDLYVAVIKDFIRTVIGKPVAAIGGSLGSDYIIRVAAEEPELIERMLLSNPTGYDLLEPENKEGRTLITSDSSRNEDFYDLLTGSVVGSLLYDVIDSPTGIDFFLLYTVYLDKSLVTPDVTQFFLDNLEGDNKAFAPFSFFAGFLEQPAADYWPNTEQPALLVWGTKDVFTPLRYAEPFMAARPDVDLIVLEARAIPYEEDFEAFNELALEFLE